MNDIEKENSKDRETERKKKMGETEREKSDGERERERNRRIKVTCKTHTTFFLFVHYN